MKRYNFLDVSTFESFEGLISEDDEGKWVLFDDVQGLISKITKESSYLDSVVLHSDVIECNCEKEFEKRNAKFSSYSYHWICPAHGYKKI